MLSLGLEPRTRWLRVTYSANWAIKALFQCWANKGTRTLNFQFGGLTLCQLSYIRIKTLLCLWGEFYRKKRLGFFRPTWPTNYTITPLKDTCNALPFELQSACRHGQIRTDNLYMFLVGPVGIEPTKFPSCKDGGLNLLAYGPVTITI